MKAGILLFSLFVFGISCLLEDPDTIDMPTEPLDSVMYVFSPDTLIGVY